MVSNASANIVIKDHGHADYLHDDDLKMALTNFLIERGPSDGPLISTQPHD